MKTSSVQSKCHDLPHIKWAAGWTTNNSTSLLTVYFQCSDYSEIEDKDEVSPLNESSPLIHAVNSDSEHERTGTVFSSIFTLVSTMVGGGILSLPFAFQEGGFIITSIILFCVLMASTHGAFLVINSKRYCQGKITNIEDVANIAFGNKGKVCFIVSSWLFKNWLIVEDKSLSEQTIW